METLITNAVCAHQPGIRLGRGRAVLGEGDGLFLALSNSGVSPKTSHFSSRTSHLAVRALSLPTSRTRRTNSRTTRTGKGDERNEKFESKTFGLFGWEKGTGCSCGKRDGLFLALSNSAVSPKTSHFSSQHLTQPFGRSRFGLRAVEGRTENNANGQGRPEKREVRIQGFESVIGSRLKPSEESLAEDAGVEWPVRRRRPVGRGGLPGKAGPGAAARRGSGRRRIPWAR